MPARALDLVELDSSGGKIMSVFAIQTKCAPSVAVSVTVLSACATPSFGSGPPKSGF